MMPFFQEIDFGVPEMLEIEDDGQNSRHNFHAYCMQQSVYNIKKQMI